VRCSMPKIRVNVATIFPDSWRNRCSTTPATSVVGVGVGGFSTF